MIGHITYLSDDVMNEKFEDSWREVSGDHESGYRFQPRTSSSRSKAICATRATFSECSLTPTPIC
jgi:hypothetical protein